MKYILIGQCSDQTSGGPSNIMRGLLKELQTMDVEVKAIFLNEKTSKRKVVLETVKTLLTEKGNLVNVHTRGYFFPLMVYLLSRLNPYNYYCLTVHGIYAIESKIAGNSKRIYCWVEHFLYKKFPNLVCVSQMLKNSIAEIFHRTGNVYVIPNATDARSEYKYNSNQAEVIFVMLGGLRKRKGISESIELMRFLIYEKNINAKLLIYGAESEGNNKEWLKKKIQEKNLDGKVVFNGYVGEKQMLYDIVAQADFQLCLSQWDTFNVAIAESLVLGCPCITTDVCGASYLIRQGDNGLVVDLDNEEKYEQIYHYVYSFYEHPEKRMRIYNSRKEYAERLSWRYVCEAYLHLAQEGTKN